MSMIVKIQPKKANTSLQTPSGVGKPHPIQQSSPDTMTTRQLHSISDTKSGHCCNEVYFRLKQL